MCRSVILVAIATALLGATPCLAQDGQPKIDPCEPSTSDLVVKVSREKPCQMTLVPKGDTNHRARLLTLSSTDPRGVFEAKYTPSVPAVSTDSLPGPALTVHWMSSAGAAARHTFVTWGYPNGSVILTRYDAGPARIDVRVTVSDDLLNLEDGYAVRMAIPQADYRRIVDYGRCAHGGPGETKCMESLVSPQSWTAQLSFSSRKDRSTADIYYLVSRWMGRHPGTEFNSPPGDKLRASESDPIVLFAGIAGVNRTVLLDCQGLRGHGPERRCDDFARPSAKTLERADYFWAVYLEDEEMPFETSIDVEFGPTVTDRDYEEFDPRLRLDPQSSETAAVRVVRIGWRRFYIREAPVAVQIAFTRQGANYGLRQWTRLYRQRSKTWVLPAAGILIPTNPPRHITTTLVPVYADGALEPSVLAITENSVRRPIFGLVSFQWPQWRSKGDDARGVRRVMINLIPDAALGMADRGMYFAGGSWPIPLWRDRSFITAGGIWTREERAAPGFSAGDRVPLTTTADDVITTQGRWRLRIGLSLEIVKLRR